MVSVIIPSRNERYLGNTCQEVMDKAQGEVEVLFILDDGSLGMRGAIELMVKHATGKYIMKLDAHCALDEGFDLKLVEHHQPDWVQIPSRRRLDAPTWTVDHENPVNLMYLNEDFVGVKNRNQDLSEMIHETETFQGSCYFMERDYFLKLGLFDPGFGTFDHEAQEIGIRVLADGGKIVTNKYTWYAHARLGRMYKADHSKRDYIKKYAEKYDYKRRA